MCIRPPFKFNSIINDIKIVIRSKTMAFAKTVVRPTVLGVIKDNNVISLNIKSVSLQHRSKKKNNFILHCHYTFLFYSVYRASGERRSLNLPFIPHIHYITLEKKWPCSFEEDSVFTIELSKHDDGRKSIGIGHLSDSGVIT